MKTYKKMCRYMMYNSITNLCGKCTYKIHCTPNQFLLRLQGMPCSVCWRLAVEGKGSPQRGSLYHTQKNEKHSKQNKTKKIKTCLLVHDGVILCVRMCLLIGTSRSVGAVGFGLVLSASARIKKYNKKYIQRLSSFFSTSSLFGSSTSFCFGSSTSSCFGSSLCGSSSYSASSSSSSFVFLFFLIIYYFYPAQQQTFVVQLLSPPRPMAACLAAKLLRLVQDIIQYDGLENDDDVN